VEFEPFVGVAPRMYMSLFAMTKRKKDGRVIQFVREVASPRYPGSPRAYLPNEVAAMSRLAAVIEQEQLQMEQQEFNYDGSRSS
jgi:hypothetical protein